MRKFIDSAEPAHKMDVLSAVVIRKVPKQSKLFFEHSFFLSDLLIPVD